MNPSLAPEAQSADYIVGVEDNQVVRIPINAQLLRFSEVLGFQHADSAITGTTNEAVLWEIEIPAGVIGPNDILICHPLLTHTNSANNKFLRVRFGPAATPLASRAVLWSVTSTTTATSGPHVAMRMRNSTSAAIMEHVVATTTGSTRGFGQSSNPIITPVVDTTVPSILSVTGQLASAGEAITMNSVVAKLERMG